MTFISDINTSTPANTDAAGQTDDQIRQLKSDVLDSFPNINAAVTGTPADLNVLTGQAAYGLVSGDLNKLADVSASATELNLLDGVPATLTTTEIGYLDGVTSGIQSQFNSLTFTVNADSGTADIDTSGSFTVAGGTALTTSGNSTDTITVTADIASDAEIDAGTATDKLVTPEKLTHLTDGSSTNKISVDALSASIRPKELIGEVSAASETSIEFTGLSGYDEYELQIEALGHGTAAGQELQIHVGTNAYDTGASDYTHNIFNRQAVSSNETANDNCFLLNLSTEYFGSTTLGSERRCFATVNILGLHDSSAATHFKSEQSLVNSAFQIFGDRSSKGFRKSNSSQNQVRITTSGGVAFTIGTVRLYGIR